jgi:hypothetical protein
MQHSAGMDMSGAPSSALPQEGRQAEFAALREISNMLQAEPKTDGDNGRHEVSAPTADGASMTVTARNDTGAAQIRALGFFGLLTGGTHHQLHHLMMAKGEMHH